MWAAIVCMQEKWLGLMTALLSHLHPLPSHRMSAHKAQVCILRGNCLDLSVEMLSMLKGCNSSETNTLCASQDDIDVHVDKTQDEFKEAWVSAGGSDLTVKPRLQLQRACSAASYQLEMHLQPGAPPSISMARDLTAGHGEWPDHCTSVFSTFSFSTSPTLWVLIFPNRVCEDSGSSTHISSLMSCKMSTVELIEIAEVSWPHRCHGCKVTLEQHWLKPLVCTHLGAKLQEWPCWRRRASSETKATMQAYFPIISFLITVVEEAITRVLGANSSTSELGFFCEEKFALGYWFSNWALWNPWRFQKFLEDFGRKHRNPEQSPRNSEHLSPMTSSWCLPLHLSILFLYDLLPCDFTTEIKIWESLKNISVYQKKMWDDKAEFFSVGITNKLVFSM